MRPLTVFQLLYVLAIAVALSIQAVGITRAARTTTEKFQAAAEAASIDNTIDLKKKDLAETVTFGLYGGATEQKEKIEAARAEAEAARQVEWKNFRIFMYITGSAALLALLIGRFSPRSDVFIATLLATSCIMLVLGICTPMLSFINEREVPVIGNVIAEAQTKSIWGSAMALFQSGNTWIGLVIVAASMAIPAVKSLLLAIVLGNRAVLVGKNSIRHESVERKLTKLASMIGSFSFVDLFIAAIFLSLFALRSLQGSTARAEPGLYYFNTYCTVSLIAGILAWRAPKPRWQPPT
ncbi:MAG: paraquat-inducible protein A [Phycisphaerales bacterium]|nr:paraquat-inducible protein A [Phycisphaerales bacterium]